MGVIMEAALLIFFIIIGGGVLWLAYTVEAFCDEEYGKGILLLAPVIILFIILWCMGIGV